jgi:mRNA-degrading endonuclease RelE of RelBE toxin-antitoxin system
MDWLMTMNLIIKQSNSFKKAVKKLPKQHKAILDEEVRKLVSNPSLLKLGTHENFYRDIKNNA